MRLQVSKCHNDPSSLPLPQSPLQFPQSPGGRQQSVSAHIYTIVPLRNSRQWSGPPAPPTAGETIVITHSYKVHSSCWSQEMKHRQRAGFIKGFPRNIHDLFLGGADVQARSNWKNLNYIKSPSFFARIFLPRLLNLSESSVARGGAGGGVRGSDKVNIFTV